MRTISTAAIAVFVCLATAAFSQNYPMPGASWEPAVLCTGCTGTNPIDGQPNNGKPTFPYGPPFVDHVGRVVDSSTTNDFQGGIIRTVRAGKVRLAPSRNRIYVQLGSAIGAYSLDTFFTARLLQPMVAANTINTGLHGGVRNPYEKLSNPDAFFYAESPSSGWQTVLLDGQDMLKDFDSDDRGYLYIASVFGSGIQQDDGRTDGSHLPFVSQDPDASPNFTFSLRVADTYYVVLSDLDTPSMGIYDSTNPASLVSVASRVGPQYGITSWAKNETAARVALVTYDYLRIYTYAGLVAGDAPLAEFAATSGKNFADLAFDDDGNLWVAETSNTISSNVLWKLTPSASTYTKTTFDVYGAPFSPSQIDAAAGWVAVGGSATDATEVRLYQLNGSGEPLFVDSGNFFRSYYHRQPAGYARPTNQTLRDLRIVAQGAKTYFLYNDHGLGDVYQFDDGKPVINSVTPLTGPPAGATSVKVYGKNFGGSPTLAFDGTLVGVTPASATELDADTPPHAPAAVNVVVTAGLDSAIAPQQFTYILAAPQNLVATGTSTTSVTATWNSVDGATQYELQRFDSDLNTWPPVGTTSSLTMDDLGLTPNTTYLYRVRALDASAYSSLPSATNFATTANFAGQTITAGMTIQVSQINDMRTAINAMRAAAGNPPISFSETVTAGTLITAQHFMELRTEVAAARAALGGSVIVFTDPTLTGLPVKAVHIQELMDAVQ